MFETKNNMDLAKEFSALRSVEALQSRSIAIHPTNAVRNHPEAIYPYDKSLVKLTNTENSSNGYINASSIPGPRSLKEFVTQNPLKETVSDFWQMIWEQHITTIVMLSSPPGHNDLENSEEYWPSRESRLFGDLLATFIKEDNYRDLTVREFTLMDVKKKKPFSIKQFQYNSWQLDGDKDVRDLLIEFVKQVQRHRKENRVKVPTLVHCRTGGSRCGIFIVLNLIITQLENTDSVDVYGTVHDLLLHRPSMIQSEQEYLFLHHCALDIIGVSDQGRSKRFYENVPQNIPQNMPQNIPEVDYENVTEHFLSTLPNSELLYLSVLDI